MTNASYDLHLHSHSPTTSTSSDKPSRLKRFSRWTQSLSLLNKLRRPKPKPDIRRQSSTQVRQLDAELPRRVLHSSKINPPPEDDQTLEVPVLDRLYESPIKLLPALSSLPPPPRHTMSRKNRIQSMQLGDLETVHVAVPIQRPRTMASRPCVLRLSLDVEQHSTLSHESNLSNDSEDRSSTYTSQSISRPGLGSRRSDPTTPFRSGTLGSIRKSDLSDLIVNRASSRLSLIERRRRRSPQTVPDDGRLLLALNDHPSDGLWQERSLISFDRDVSRQEAMFALEGRRISDTTTASFGRDKPSYDNDFPINDDIIRRRSALEDQDNSLHIIPENTNTPPSSANIKARTPSLIYFPSSPSSAGSLEQVSE
ncbi:hypothetical protein CLU79DRAFT_755225 [Phycomyces nitens]|nr:hypothetical protein CLU79DRAFT_755225 [Phycomyces nitens]